MTLRLAAVLALLVGVGGYLGFLQVVGKGPFVDLEQANLRTLKDRRTAPPAYAPVTFADLAALPHHESLADYAPLERRGVVLEGWVQRMLRAPDGDTHLEVTAIPRRPDSPDTVYATAEITPQWTRRSARWSYEALFETLRPNRGGETPWPSGPRRVRVGGWLLYDFQYDAPLPALLAAGQSPRLTGWEIHPVTRIEVWDDSLARFVEVRP